MQKSLFEKREAHHVKVWTKNLLPPIIGFQISDRIPEKQKLVMLGSILQLKLRSDTPLRAMISKSITELHKYKAAELGKK
jgi:hypothetical protein